MNSNPENFDALRRLLTLKRYEQPPPGYFDTFSSKITARIRAGERGEPDSVLQRLFGEAGWWQRVCASMQSRPGFAGAFGAAVCALVISGIVFSENTPAPGVQALVPGESSGALFAAAGLPGDSVIQTDFGFARTNSLSAASGSLFEQVQSFQTQPASFVIPGGN